MLLSCCAIVKDEAHQIARCLNSVRGFADEVIVLDTGSSDDTVAIAQSCGAAVHHFDWVNDFSSARNAAMQYVNGDWVLMLDADEALVPAIVPLLRQLMQQPEALVINLVRQEIGAVQSPYSLVSRLFRRHPRLYFTRPYHAMIDDSVTQLLQQEPHWRVLDCAEVALLHYGYSPDQISDRRKLDRARTTMEGFFAAHPHDPYVCSKLGALYLQTGDRARGIQLLEQGLVSYWAGDAPTGESPDQNSSPDKNSSLDQLDRNLSLDNSPPLSQLHSADRSPDRDAPILYELHYHLGIAQRSQNPDLAAQHYQQAIAQPILESLKLGAYNNLGTLRQSQGDLAAAETLYRRCLAIDPTFASAHYNLGTIARAQGRLDAAIAHYQKALQINPHYAEAYQNLGVVWLKQGNLHSSRQAFQQAIDLYQQHNPTEADRLRQSLASLGINLAPPKA